MVPHPSSTWRASLADCTPNRFFEIAHPRRTCASHMGVWMRELDLAVIARSHSVGRATKQSRGPRDSGLSAQVRRARAENASLRRTSGLLWLPTVLGALT